MMVTMTRMHPVAARSQGLCGFFLSIGGDFFCLYHNKKSASDSEEFFEYKKKTKDSGWW